MRLEPAREGRLADRRNPDRAILLGRDAFEHEQLLVNGALQGTE
jgi:hypothetical protein